MNEIIIEGVPRNSLRDLIQTIWSKVLSKQAKKGNLQGTQMKMKLPLKKVKSSDPTQPELKFPTDSTDPKQFEFPIVPKTPIKKVKKPRVKKPEYNPSPITTQIISLENKKNTAVYVGDWTAEDEFRLMKLKELEQEEINRAYEELLRKRKLYGGSYKRAESPSDIKENGGGYVYDKDMAKDPKHIGGERWRIKFQSAKDLKKHGNTETSPLSEIISLREVKDIIKELVDEMWVGWEENQQLNEKVLLQSKPTPKEPEELWNLVDKLSPGQSISFYNAHNPNPEITAPWIYIKKTSGNTFDIGIEQRLDAKYSRSVLVAAEDVKSEEGVTEDDVSLALEVVVKNPTLLSMYYIETTGNKPVEPLQEIAPNDRNTQLLQFIAQHPDLIKAMREWVKDCQWGEQYEDSDVDELPDIVILRGVEKYYDGGIRQFMADAGL